MAKKVLLGVAVVAVVVVGYIAYKGSPRTGPGTDATIQQADRYRSDISQIQSEDVILADNQVQELLQTDFFFRLATDKSFQKVVGTGLLRNLDAEGRIAVSRAFDDPAVQKALAQRDVEAAARVAEKLVSERYADARAVERVLDKTFETVLKNDDFQKNVEAKNYDAAMRNVEKVAEAKVAEERLMDQKVVERVLDKTFETVLKNDDFQKNVEAKNYDAAMRNVEKVAEAKVAEERLMDQKVVERVLDKTFETVLKNDDFQKNVEAKNYDAAMRNVEKVAEAKVAEERLMDQKVVERVLDKTFETVLKNDDFQKNVEAKNYDAAMRNVEKVAEAKVAEERLMDQKVVERVLDKTFETVLKNDDFQKNVEAKNYDAAMRNVEKVAEAKVAEERLMDQKVVERVLDKTFETVLKNDDFQKNVEAKNYDAAMRNVEKVAEAKVAEERLMDQKVVERVLDKTFETVLKNDDFQKNVEAKNYDAAMRNVEKVAEAKVAEERLMDQKVVERVLDKTFETVLKNDDFQKNVEAKNYDAAMRNVEKVAEAKVTELKAADEKMFTEVLRSPEMREFCEKAADGRITDFQKVMDNKAFDKLLQNREIEQKLAEGKVQELIAER